MSERKMPTVEDFPSNAIGSSEENDHRPALKGKVKRKQSIFRSVRDEFISEDADNMGTYLLNDILFPALRDLINDICHGAIDAAFGGGGYRRGSSRRGRGGSYISYDRMYDRPSRRSRRSRYDDDDDYDDRPRRRRIPDCSEYTFDADRFGSSSAAKRAAMDLLDDMADRLEEYGEVNVAWFLDQIGEDVVGSWNAEDWGWTNLAGVKVRGSSRNGWYIDLPRPKEL